MTRNKGAEVCLNCGNFTSQRQDSLQGTIGPDEGVCLFYKPNATQIQDGVKEVTIRIVRKDNPCDISGFITPDDKKNNDIREITLGLKGINFSTRFCQLSLFTDIAHQLKFQTGKSGLLFLHTNHKIRTIIDFLKFAQNHEDWKEIIRESISDTAHPERLLKESPRWDFITNLLEKILQDYSPR